MNVRLLKRRHEPPPHPLLRIARIAAGALIIIVGVVLTFPGVPGPGSLIVLAGLWLVSADVRLARRILIRLRIHLRKVRKRYRVWRARSRG